MMSRKENAFLNRDQNIRVKGGVADPKKILKTDYREGLALVL
jgi:hypothetical protein